MSNHKSREYYLCHCFNCRHGSTAYKKAVLTNVKRSIRQSTNRKLKQEGEDFELKELRGGIYLD